MSEMITKGNIDRLLKEGIINVVFKKTDGTERTMKCTQMESFITPYQRKTAVENNNTVRERERSDQTASVWDIDKNAWRSFRYDSVIKVYK